jgi:hypothetical protein
MKINFNKIARRWLADANRIEMMREQLVKIRRATKRLEESVTNLEEQVKVLEERNKTLEETKTKKGK